MVCVCGYVCVYTCVRSMHGVSVLYMCAYVHVGGYLYGCVGVCV